MKESTREARERFSQGEASTREKLSASGLRPNLCFGRVWAMLGGTAPNPRGTAEVLPPRGGGREPAPRTGKSQSFVMQHSPELQVDPVPPSPAPGLRHHLGRMPRSCLVSPGALRKRGGDGVVVTPSKRHFSKRGFQERPGTSSFPRAGGCCWVCPSPAPRRPRGRRLKDEEQSPKTPSPSVFGCHNPIALCPLSPRHSPGPPSSRINPKR